MKKLLSVLCCAASLTASAQGPGLIISEFLPNPSGTDSPFEYVELVATRTIDFSITPYSVVWCNNGTATAQGWVNGGSLSYGFNITSGTVNQGDVVYVGGSSMSPTGTQLRTIHTGTTGGDGFGSFSTGGVMGNGGGNADGIAVFDMDVSLLTNSTVPVDAVFYGSGIGSALVSGGNDGYQLPYNDLYAGGKLQAGSYLAPDPASTEVVVATGGEFNPATGSFTTARTFAIAPGTDGTTAITLSSAVASVSFTIASNNQTVTESGMTATFNINVSAANSAQAIVQVTASGLTNATAGTDYMISNPVIVVPAGSTTTQTVIVNIPEDLLKEQDEYVAFSLTPLTNAAPTGSNLHVLYIKDNDNAAPAYTNELNLQLLGSYSNGTEGSSSAEIVAHDPTTQRLYIANSIGGKMDILDFSNPASIAPITSIDMSTYGGINSIAVYNGLVAAAVENGTNPQDSGKIVFFDASGVFLNSVNAGAMPDMITFNHTGTKVIAACEGEPSDDYLNDPQGCVTIVDVSGGVASLTPANVDFATFTSYIGQETTLRAMGIRIYGPGANAAQDFEPEYVTISDDDNTAWVTLQENNAVAVIDLSTNTVTSIQPLGYKDHLATGNGLDASDQTVGINLSNFPIKGMYLPDAISQINIGGTPYLLTANEGDARDYGAFSEEARINSLSLDAAAYPDAVQLKSNVVAGRLTVTNALGDTDSDGDIDQIYSMGTRSFSIWNGNTGALVYDSGDDFERITSQHPDFSAMFNASNGSSISVKNRSDDKGPEPEGVTVAEFNGEYFAFASLERVGGVMIYNISNPASPQFVGYHNNRNIATNGPDRGTEGMIFIRPSASPNGNAILLLANEVSSTLSVYQVNTCSELSGVTLMASNTTEICEEDSTNLYTAPQAGVTYQWYGNDTLITGATDTLLTVFDPGHYTLHFTNATGACSGNISMDVTVNPLPLVTASATVDEVCAGETTVLTGGGADTYTWTGGVNDGVAFVPLATADYVVEGALGATGCSNTDTIIIAVNPLPVPVVTFSNPDLVTGSFATYQWYLSGSPISGANGMAYTPTVNGNYTVTVTDANGCEGTSSVFALTTLGSDGSMNGSGYSIYPNPFNATLKITVPAGVQPSVAVLNVYGQQVYHQAVYNGETIDLSQLESGVYLVTVSAESSVMQFEVVKN